MRYLVTVVDTQHEAWGALVNHEGKLAELVQSLAQNDKVEAEEHEVVLLRSWLARLGASNLVKFEELVQSPIA